MFLHSQRSQTSTSDVSFGFEQNGLFELLLCRHMACRAWRLPCSVLPPCLVEHTGTKTPSDNCDLRFADSCKAHRSEQHNCADLLRSPHQASLSRRTARLNTLLVGRSAGCSDAIWLSLHRDLV